MVNEAVLLMMCLGYGKLPHDKVFIGLQIDSLLFEIHCGVSYHHSSDISSGNTSGQGWVHVQRRRTHHGFFNFIIFSFVNNIF